MGGKGAHRFCRRVSCVSDAGSVPARPMLASDLAQACISSLGLQEHGAPSFEQRLPNEHEQHGLVPTSSAKKGGSLGRGSQPQKAAASSHDADTGDSRPPYSPDSV